MVPDIDMKATTPEHIRHCVKMFRLNPPNRDPLSSYCACNEKCTSLNPIGDHPVFCAVQFRHTFDDESSRSSPLDLGSHLVKEVGQVHHLRLLGRAFNNCDTIRQNRSH